MQQKKNAETQPEKIIIGMIPTGNPENLRKQALELAQQLQLTLNKPVNIYISKNYTGLVAGDKTSKKYSEVLGTKDLMPATNHQYNSVRNMVELMKIELK